MPPGSLVHFHLLRDAWLRRCLLFTATCLPLLMALAASAKEDHPITLHNSCDLPIVGFLIEESENNWSQNWITGEALMPGAVFNLEPDANDRCEARVRVITQDRYFQDYLVDFCRAREIFIENNRVSYR